jgi:hypothetical protein
MGSAAKFPQTTLRMIHPPQRKAIVHVHGSTRLQSIRGCCTTVALLTLKGTSNPCARQGIAASLRMSASDNCVKSLWDSSPSCWRWSVSHLHAAGCGQPSMRTRHTHMRTSQATQPAAARCPLLPTLQIRWPRLQVRWPFRQTNLIGCTQADLEYSANLGQRCSNKR